MTEYPGRFVVHAYDCYYPCGGFDGDLVAKVATREEADSVATRYDGRRDYVEVTDLLAEMKERQEPNR